MKDNTTAPTVRLLGMLGIAKKAGKIISGTELVCDAVRHGKACHVYIAHDASGNTNKRLINCCSFYKTPCTVIKVNGTELAKAIGKGHSTVAAAAITDISFTAAINKIIDENSECCKAGVISAGGADNDTKSEIQDQ